MYSPVPRPGSPSCVEGTCLALRDSDILKVPILARNVPILNALYMATLRLIPGSRVTSVEYIGRNAIGTVFGSGEFWTEVMLVTGVDRPIRKKN